MRIFFKNLLDSFKIFMRIFLKNLLDSFKTFIQNSREMNSTTLSIFFKNLFKTFMRIFLKNLLDLFKTFIQSGRKINLTTLNIFLKKQIGDTIFTIKFICIYNWIDKDFAYYITNLDEADFSFNVNIGIFIFFILTAHSIRESEKFQEDIQNFFFKFWHENKFILIFCKFLKFNLTRIFIHFFNKNNKFIHNFITIIIFFKSYFLSLFIFWRPLFRKCSYIHKYFKTYFND